MQVFESSQAAPRFLKLNSETQDENWTYIRRSENTLDIFWTPYVRSIYMLCPAEHLGGISSSNFSGIRKYKSV